MNGQIKQRCGEVWPFTSKGNFSHHGQALWGMKKQTETKGQTNCTSYDLCWIYLHLLRVLHLRTVQKTRTRLKKTTCILQSASAHMLGNGI